MIGDRDEVEVKASKRRMLVPKKRKDYHKKKEDIFVMLVIYAHVNGFYRAEITIKQIFFCVKGYW
jgi:hypothetical protein